ncbi:MAG TPA: DinB family protein [Gemmatimonadaceae bacterium]|nr:DinB family protein [Gemmatimonadaceae bacterium]
MKERTNVLAERLEVGARALATFASTLTDEEWQLRIPHDGRKVGVVVHHVASMYPIEIEIAQKAARGEQIAGVTWDLVNSINANHAAQFEDVTKAEAIDLLGRNSDAAASAIRALDDADLDRAVPLSLNDDAPLTCQFVLEDHAVRHSYHHLAVIRSALQMATVEF